MEKIDNDVIYHLTNEKKEGENENYRYPINLNQLTSKYLPLSMSVDIIFRQYTNKSREVVINGLMGRSSASTTKRLAITIRSETVNNGSSN
ncbi:hypothetical protein ACH3XW_41825 [Acanthocheilonema viteae]